MRVIGVTASAVATSASPDAEALEDEPRAVRQRERAVAAQRFALGARVEHHDVEIAVGERQRERRADRAGPDDDDVMQHQRRQAASTSATDFGAATVRFSMPVAVTSTSSSMRTPMSQNASGTLSAGRM